MATITIHIPDDLKPQYANMVRISHSPAEIIFDFAQVLPHADKANVVTRMIMTPIGARMFMNALAENLARFEASFGEIKLPSGQSLAGDLFRSIQPPEGSNQAE